jgi:hypothetical protein
MIKNRVVEVLRITPKPKMEAIDISNKPLIFPSEESTTLAKLKRILFEIANKTAGPGLKVVIEATAINKNQVESNIEMVL